MIQTSWYFLTENARLVESKQVTFDIRARRHTTLTAALSGRQHLAIADL